MSNLCESLISQAISANCENPLVRGLEADGVIINRSDVDFASCTMTGNIVSSLVLKTGKTGYAVKQLGATPFTGTGTSMTTGTYRNVFTNNVSIAILDNSPTVSQNVIDGLANGSFIVVLKNRHAGTDGKSTFQIYGYFQGLTASAIEEEKYSEDLDGGWLVTLTETGAPKSALFLFGNSLEATQAMFDSLTGGE